MLAQQDCDIANKGDEANYTANHVLLAVQERLTLCVELGIVCEVVVALGKEAEGCFAARMSLYALFVSFIECTALRFYTRRLLLSMIAFFGVLGC